MKKEKSDGTTYYYYYKKKLGRHKKSGRKKRKKSRGRRWQKTWDFKILRFDFKKQETYIGTYHDLDEALSVKAILEENNKSVVFPKKFVSNGHKDRKLIELESEYAILKRVRDLDNGTNVTQLRDQYGKFVDHQTTSENWAIVDKFPCLIEETFWVYGYNPKTDRKTFEWIYKNLVTNYAEEKNNLVMVFVYLNKVIFKYEEDFTFVICKNQSDAIRMYNLIEERTKRVKNVMMTGATGTKTDRGQALIEQIMEKTGWTRRKVTSKSTRT